MLLGSLDVLTTLPESLILNSEDSQWGARRWRNPQIGAFLEGPVLAAPDELLFVDVAHGRVLRWDGSSCSEVIRYDGEPNGLALDHDGSLWIADAKLGLLRTDPRHPDPTIELVRADINGLPLLGLNDLVLDATGSIIVTDQGDTGLQDPNGRVLRLNQAGQFEVLLHTAPSPNGIAIEPGGMALLIAVTRDNSIWRGVFTDDGRLTRVGRYIQLSGGVGPDGIAVTSSGTLFVARLGLGRVDVFDYRGLQVGWWDTPEGSLPTNVCVDESAQTLYVTEAESASILIADISNFA